MGTLASFDRLDVRMRNSGAPGHLLCDLPHGDALHPPQGFVAAPYTSPCR
jgi:hypothetical protein